MKKNILLWLIIITSGFCKAEITKNSLSDSLFKTGQLTNGLTYYIYHNPASAGHTSYYLVQNVGSLLEKDNQNGLAHFLEHMAFNGSLHFPKKSMLQMLEKQGVSLSRGINAYTSLNETLYGIDNVPNTQGMQDSCLLILHDWSHFLSLDSSAIEAERPVILEEWRTRRDAGFRLKSQTTPVILKGSQYAIRDIIGDTTVIRSISQEAFRKFYQAWYRPDLQAILIIGDLDIARTEQQIRTLFSDIPAVTNAPERPFFEIPLEKFTFVQATDPETPRIRIQISTRQKTVDNEKLSIICLKEDLQTKLFNQLMQERIFEVFRKNNVPSMGASIVRHNPQRGYNALSLTVIPRPGDEEKVVKALLTEKERVRQHGFTKGEMERAKAILLREAETAASNKDKQPNAFYIEKYSQHFLEDELIQDPETYLEFIRQELPGITSGQLTGLLKKWDDGSNYAVSVTGPEQMLKMDGNQIRQWLTTIGTTQLSPYEEEEHTGLSIADSLPGGKIIRENPLKEFEAKEWILSNGTKVVFKPVTSSQQISLLAFREGGTSNCPPEELPTATLLPNLVDNYGLHHLDALQLNKILSVKGISSGISIRSLYEAIAGQAPASELEALLQIIWLRFEHPRFDPSTHQGMINNFKTRWSMQSKDPFKQINDTLIATLSNYNPRALPLQAGEFDKITLKRTELLYRKTFADPASFTFLITGNGEEKQIKQMVEKYIGSFPTRTVTPQIIKQEANFPAWKKLTKTRIMPFAGQKSTVLINLVSELDYTLENKYYLNLFSQLIGSRCMKELREKDGAVYNVSVQKEFEALPAGKAILMVVFDCAPGQEQELSERVNRIFNELSQKRPSVEELQRVIKNLKSEQQMNAENNQEWINALFSWYFYNINIADKEYTEQLYARTSTRSSVAFFRKFLKKNHQTEFFFTPEQK